jgi:hypothetical protein
MALAVVKAAITNATIGINPVCRITNAPKAFIRPVGNYPTDSDWPQRIMDDRVKLTGGCVGFVFMHDESVAS